MTVLSKMYYDSPSGWIEGGTTGVGDFHCWIEDGNGKVIYDPYFGEYEFICKIQHCDVKSPVYKIWPNQKKWLNEKKPQRIPADVTLTGSMVRLDRSCNNKFLCEL
jgi:hypothetical protein